MARYMVGAKTTGAGSTTLPLISLYNTAAVVAKVREIGLFNTTNTATDMKLGILSAGTGTQGAALTEAAYDSGSGTAVATGFNTHTVTPTTITDGGYRVSLGAAIGAGVIWTFGDSGLRTGKTTNDAFGILVENGTGQILQAYFVWDE